MNEAVFKGAMMANQEKQGDVVLREARKKAIQKLSIPKHSGSNYSITKTSGRIVISSKSSKN